MSKVKSDIINITSKVTIISVIGNALNIPLKMLTASLLLPAGYGILSLANTIQNYASHVDLGAHLGMNREIPILLGQKKEQEASIIALLTFYWMSFVTVVICLVFAIFLYFDSLPNIFTFAEVIFILIIILLSRATKYLLNYIRPYGNFSGIPAKSSIDMLLFPILSVLLAYYYNVTGVLFAQLVCVFLLFYLVLGYYRSIEKIQIDYKFRFRDLYDFLLRNINLYYRSLITNVYLLFEITVIVILLSSEDLGIYAFALGLYTSLGGIKASIDEIVQRQMLYEKGELGSQKDYSGFMKYFRTNFFLYLFFLVLLFGTASIVFTRLIDFFLIDFFPSIIISVVLFLEILFFSSATIPFLFLNSLGRLKTNTLIISFSLAIKIFFTIILIHFDKISLLNIAYVSLFGSFVFFTITFLVSTKNLLVSNFSLTEQYLRILLTIIISFILIYKVTFINLHQISIIVSSNIIFQLFFDATVKVVVFTILNLILFSAMFYKYRILNEFRKVIYSFNLVWRS